MVGYTYKYIYIHFFFKGVAFEVLNIKIGMRLLKVAFPNLNHMYCQHNILDTLKYLYAGGWILVVNEMKIFVVLCNGV